MTFDLPTPVPHPDGVEESLRFAEVTSPDGTRLVGWTNDVDGPPVLVCNGLGTPAYAWPALLTPDAGVRAIGWHHRGLGGSERPADPRAVTVDDFVTDAIATMDAFGVERAVVAGWSIGVNTMFELALRHPDRVAGLFAVAGVPGDTFASLFGAAPLPRSVRRAAGRTIAKGLSAAARPLAALQRGYDINETVGKVLTHTGFMLPSDDLAGLRRGVGVFLDMPLDWYMHVAHTASLHLGSELSTLDVPTYFLAGKYDIIARASDQRAAAAAIPDAVYDELPGSHFLTMEKPAEVHRRLLDFVAQVEAAESVSE